MSDSEDSIFCVLKHLATALVQSTEYYEDSSSVGEIISILTDAKISPCSACKADMEKGEYIGIQTA